MTGVREICEKNICNDAGCVYNMHEELCIYTQFHTLKIQYKTIPKKA